VEVGTKRVFASALDWLGWTRSGKDEKAALETLAAYAPRYAPVTKIARLPFPAGASPSLKVAERVRGNATTDFGAPAIPASADTKELSKTEVERACSLLIASWTTFDRVAAKAPAELRKGPRGGGRDRDKIIDHVLGAESAYAPKIGLKLRQPDIGDTKAIKAFRDAILTAIRESAGSGAQETKWPARYAARRIAWHALDHAWEIEDRS
jgi:hypothetical protein